MYQVQGNDDAWVCENCKKSFTDPDAKMLECQRCRAHYCIRCLDKSINEYEMLSNSDLMWFCGPCKGKVEKKPIVTDLKIEKRCNAIIREFEDRLSSLENEISSKGNKSDVRRIVREEINNNKTDINSATELLITSQRQSQKQLLFQ